MYAEDWDLPPRENWMDAITPYTKNHVMEHCSEVRGPAEYGYAYNSQLSGLDETKIADPGKLPMIYDSTNLARNASDPVASLPKPGRHEGRNSISYADGHARAAKP